MIGSVFSNILIAVGLSGHYQSIGNAKDPDWQKGDVVKGHKYQFSLYEKKQDTTHCTVLEGDLADSDDSEKNHKFVLKFAMKDDDLEHLITEYKMQLLFNEWEVKGNNIVLMLDNNIDSRNMNNLKVIDGYRPWIAYRNYKIDLYTFIGEMVDEKTFNFKHLKFVIRDVLRGLVVLHEKGYSHFDVKSTNIVVSSFDSDSVRVKLIDFGLTTFSHTAGLVGVPRFMAPERLLKKFPYRTNNNSDIWSVGIVMHEIKSRSYFICLDDDFFEKKLSDYVKTDLGDVYKERYHIFGESDSLQKEVNCNSGSRKEYHKDCIIEQYDKDCYCDLLLKMLTVNPEKRISSKEALKHPFFAAIKHEL